jgi:UDP-glucuronate 4-epimerase
LTWLVTGCAGFIGHATALALLARGEEVVGLDNINDYYDVRLKERRLAQLTAQKGFRFARVDLADSTALAALFASARFSKIIHLAAQAGVRYSLQNPAAYIASNIVGFQNLIDLVCKAGVQHFVFASSSSVYGANTKLPFSVTDNVDHPLSLYAATKKSNELVAHCYAHLHGLPTTGLRFFTVYGPWGRPDMSMFLFTQKIFAGAPIDVYNNGDHRRDFTYIDDIVDGVLRVADHPPQPDPNWSGDHPDPSTSKAPYRIYNIGNNKPVRLLDYIETIEQAIGKPAVKRFLPLQPGDVPATFADIDSIRRDVGFEPRTALAEGIKRFVAWYRSYHGIAP